MSLRTCSQCGFFKEFFEFNKNSFMADGLRSYCRLCQANLKRVYLKKKEKEMNAAMYESKRKGLNSQLRKVLDATPIQEPWMATAVSAEMRRERPDKKVSKPAEWIPSRTSRDAFNVWNN